MRISRVFVLTVIPVILLVTMGVNMAQEKADERQQIFVNVKQLIAEKDRSRAVEFINGYGDPLKVSEIYNTIVIDFYRKDKTLPEVISFAQTGIQFCLTKADEYKNEDPELYHGLRKNAKKIAYNLASFCWPGWNQEDIIISADDIAVGLDAARLSVRLGEELQARDLPLSVDYWVLGAQLLASQEYEEAIKTFKKSKELAHKSGDNMSELLADGYIGITMIVSGDKNGQKMLEEATNSLAEDGSEDAKFFIEQFNTALNVFIK